MSCRGGSSRCGVDGHARPSEGVVVVGVVEVEVEAGLVNERSDDKLDVDKG